MSNAELHLKMKSYEDTYSATKSKIITLVEELQKLDREYIKAKEEMNRRNTEEMLGE